MNGCIYRTEGGKCKQFSVGGVLSYCYLDGTCDCQIPSNADRIRAMSDEELAEFIGQHDCLDCPLNGEETWCDRRPGETCHSALLRWLKEEATD